MKLARRCTGDPISSKGVAGRFDAAQPIGRGRPTRIVLLSAFLAGCTPAPTRVDTPQVQALDKSFAIELPTGWIRQYIGTDRHLVASRNGLPLESLAVSHRSLKEAFPRTKKAAAETMLPSELAELQVAELKARDELSAALSVLDNEPAQLGRKEGFRLKVAWRNLRGLEYHEELLGMVDKTGYYVVSYRAPRLYYFENYYPDFQKSVASFELTPAAK